MLWEVLGRFPAGKGRGLSCIFIKTTGMVSESEGDKETILGASAAAQQGVSPTNIHEDSGSIPALARWVKDPALPQAAVYVGLRSTSDLALPWLWSRPAPAAPIQPLVWELPYGLDSATKRKKEKAME